VLSSAYSDAIADALAAGGGEAAAQPMIDAAVAAWAAEAGPLDKNEIAQLLADAQVELQDRKRRPPPIGIIIQGWEDRPDYAYQAGDLGGFQGIWHRMWALLCLETTMDLHPTGEEQASLQLRREFEERLGRSFSPEEWAALREHARLHAAWMSQ
jgi:hypothetical protein